MLSSLRAARTVSRASSWRTDSWRASLPPLCISRRDSCRSVANTTTSTNTSRVEYKSRATESTQTWSFASLGQGFYCRRQNAQCILRKFSLAASVWASLAHRIAVVPERSSDVCVPREERRWSGDSAHGVLGCCVIVQRQREQWLSIHCRTRQASTAADKNKKQKRFQRLKKPQLMYARI